MTEPNLRLIDPRLFGESIRADARRDADRARAIDIWLELAIVVLTFTSLWLVTSTGAYVAWGYVVGLASQPFWIASTWRARRWGMLVVAVLMVGLWARGIVNHFS